MNKLIYPIKHKEQEIIYTDWRDMKEPEAFKQAIKETSNWLVDRGEKQLLEIVDVRGASFNFDVYGELKKVAAATRDFNRRKAVVIDFSDRRLLMLRFLNSFSKDKITPFQKLEDAKEWLVEVVQMS
ncbi:MAG: hypothetical protein F6K17_29495 [Okeania sp. SIO3C4]|nr:hypothetical protein [Okeania sp. SIO3C4]